MDKIIFKKQQPIIIGLAGRAGSGKTSVAEAIVPKAAFETVKYGMKWDHIFYALPLYEMASSKKNIQGLSSDSRKKYALHDILYEIYGRSSIGMIH
jgi:ABC-type polysaccharide/polyol phosphate transport system ATPase subunit